MNLIYKKLSESQLSEIVTQIRQGVPYRKINKQYEISLSTLTRIKFDYLGGSTLKPRIPVGEKERSEIIELIDQGVSYRTICKQYNILSTATIYKIKHGPLPSKIPVKRTERRIERIKFLFDLLPSSDQKNVLKLLENSISGDIIKRDCQP